MSFFLVGLRLGYEVFLCELEKDIFSGWLIGKGIFFFDYM